VPGTELPGGLWRSASRLTPAMCRAVDPRPSSQTSIWRRFPEVFAVECRSSSVAQAHFDWQANVVVKRRYGCGVERIEARIKRDSPLA